MTEIVFEKIGNTIIGNYSNYRKLSEVIKAKKIPEPIGYTIVINDDVDANSLTEFISLFASQITLLSAATAWKKACKYANIIFKKSTPITI